MFKWGRQESLDTAFHHFDAQLQRDLEPPNSGLTNFIKQVQMRQESWYQVYSSYGKPPPLGARPWSIGPMQAMTIGAVMKDARIIIDRMLLDRTSDDAYLNDLKSSEVLIACMHSLIALSGDLHSFSLIFLQQSIYVTH